MACGCGTTPCICACSNCTDLCTAVYALNAFPVPACDQSVIINVAGLKVIIVGAYLWNPTYGYFKVASFNSITGQVLLTNECLDGNSAVGTVVPACTPFAITPPPPLDPLDVVCSVARECISVLDTFSIDMSYDSVTGVISASSIISPDANNSIVIRDNGLYCFPAETDCPTVRNCISVEDTSSIDMTYTPITGVISAVTKISADAGNIISIHGDGLYGSPTTVNCAAVRACVSVVDSLSIDMIYSVGPGIFSAVARISADAGNTISIHGDGLYAASNTLTCTEVRACLNVGDTPSINLTYTAGIIFGDCKISATGGNIISILSDGLYVAATATNCTAVRACLSVVDTSSIDLTYTAGAISGVAKISATAGNIISINADGLYAAATALNCATVRTCISILDTPSINLTYDSGTGVIYGDAKISVDSGNIISIHADGLYVAATPTNCPFVRLCISATDTASIDLTYNSAAGVLSADSKISVTAGNIITINADGLYVPASATDCTAVRACLSVVDTTSIDLTFAAGAISGVTKISATAGNVISINADGLYVSAGTTDCTAVRACITPADTSSIDLTFVLGILSGVTKLSATVGNIISINADGLYAAATATDCATVRTCISVADTTSIDFSYNSTSGVITGAVRVSADAGNIISVHADGLYAALTTDCAAVRTCLSVLDTNSFDFTYNSITGVISGSSKISATAGNIIVINADGLYATAIVDCTATRACITVVDSASFDFTYSFGAISGNSKISATAGNVITINADGLYVPAGSTDCPAVRACISILDTNSIDFSYNSVTGVISGSSKISATAGNIIVINADGLYATAITDCTATRACLTVVDTASIDFTYSFGAISGSSKISATAGNVITINGDGLYVPTPTTDCTAVRACLSVQDTPSFDFSFSSGIISGSSKISATPGNTIIINADGLYVPTPTPYTCTDVRACLSVTDTSSIDLTYSAGAFSGVSKISSDVGNTISIHADGLYVASGASTTDNAGWFPASGTWTYNGTTTNGYLIDVPSGALTFYQKGDKVRLIHAATTKYFYIMDVPTNTQVTVTGGSDYTLSASAFTSVFISRMDIPFGFPEAFNWAPTITGFSSAPSGSVYRFSLKGKICTLLVFMGVGSSNTSSLALTAPIITGNISNMVWGALCHNSTNNSVISVDPAVVRVSNLSVNLLLFSTIAGAGWVSSGSKKADFTLTYEI